MSRRTRWWLALFALLALVALAAWWLWRERPAPPPPPGEAFEPGIAVPYEFIWAEGATRGIDIPREILIPSLGKRVPIRSIGDIASEPGEALVPFLQRVRLAMVDYSQRQTYEACAEICGNDQGFSVRMTSNGAVTTCAVAPVCMEGHSTLGQSIHSHCPSRPNLRPTLVDEIMSGGRMRKGRPFGRCDTDRFSRDDFATGRPGWLAGLRALYRQRGPRDITTFRAEP